MVLGAIPKPETMLHFNDCFTPDEIKARYRKLAMSLHPDKGGTDAEFRDLQEQYERRLSQADREPQLPPYFHVDRHYTYFRAKVTYYQRDNHWYKFHKMAGADIWIDRDHLHLIKVENSVIA